MVHVRMSGTGIGDAPDSTTVMTIGGGDVIRS
jgi:hypothetical protein